MAAPKQGYDIAQDIHGERGGVPYAYEAGFVKPRDAKEKRLLDKLVAIGVAKVVTGVKLADDKER